MSYQQVLSDITKVAKNNNKNPAQIKLLAVSKYASVEQIFSLYQQGQLAFGENQVQSWSEKKNKLEHMGVENIAWHFIGPLQANKTKQVAQGFSWLHSLTRNKIAKKLNDQRPNNLAPLNICIQINFDGSVKKAGIASDNLEEIIDLIKYIQDLPNLKLRGLMAIPDKLDNYESNLAHAKMVFSQCQNLYLDLNKKLNLSLDTLSLGMSSDYKEAIACGATIIRVGSKLFA